LGASAFAGVNGFGAREAVGGHPPPFFSFSFSFPIFSTFFPPKSTFLPCVATPPTPPNPVAENAPSNPPAFSASTSTVMPCSSTLTDRGDEKSGPGCRFVVVLAPRGDTTAVNFVSLHGLRLPPPTTVATGGGAGHWTGTGIGTMRSRSSKFVSLGSPSAVFFAAWTRLLTLKLEEAGERRAAVGVVGREEDFARIELVEDKDDGRGLDLGDLNFSLRSTMPPPPPPPPLPPPLPPRPRPCDRCRCCCTGGVVVVVMVPSPLGERSFLISISAILSSNLLTTTSAAFVLSYESLRAWNRLRTFFSLSSPPLGLLPLLPLLPLLYLSLPPPPVILLTASRCLLSSYPPRFPPPLYLKSPPSSFTLLRTSARSRPTRPVSSWRRRRVWDSTGVRREVDRRCWAVTEEEEEEEEEPPCPEVWMLRYSLLTRAWRVSRSFSPPRRDAAVDDDEEREVEERRRLERREVSFSERRREEEEEEEPPEPEPPFGFNRCRRASRPDKDSVKLEQICQIWPENSLWHAISGGGGGAGCCSCSCCC